MDDLFRVYEDAGPDGYPPEWHETIKHLVRERARHRCVRCGHPYRNGEHGNGEWSPCDERCSHGSPIRYRWDGGDWSNTHLSGDRWNYGATLDVGWSIREGQLMEADVEAQWRILTVHHLNGVKLDCRWWNLASLCQRCHLRIQRTVVIPRVFPWEHSEWFKPYAAGWYAFAYLGEELSREETLARLDELLALERAA